MLRSEPSLDHTDHEVALADPNELEQAVIVLLVALHFPGKVIDAVDAGKVVFGRISVLVNRKGIVSILLVLIVEILAV